MNQKTFTNDEEAFPRFNEKELDLLQEAGNVCRFKKGDFIVRAGTRKYNCYFVLSGLAQVLDVSQDSPEEVTVHERGDFIGDLDLLTGRPAVVDIIAQTDVEAVCVLSDELRKFLVKYPSIGDVLMIAFTRRRKLLHRTGFAGIRLYGQRDCEKTLQIQEFFYRNGVPHTWMDIDKPDNIKRIESTGVKDAELPLLTYGAHEIFRNPELHEIAAHIGIQLNIRNICYDVVIIGAGPSGLGAAVYASSEGLSTLVIDNIGPGGQAGSSSKIENYAGFPAGISGRDLALRSYLQALKFGADFVAPCTAQKIRHAEDSRYEIELSTGETALTKTIIVSTGISYRQLKVDGMARLRSSRVFYNATQVEALLCERKPVHVVGAGNSAGQAVMFLSKYANEVHLLIRGDNIAKSMSEYLWSRIQQNPKINIRYRNELKSIEGERTIEAIHILDNRTGEVVREATSGVFIFIGGVPCTDFLPEDMSRDEKGFVQVGTHLVGSGNWSEGRLPGELESSYPGIFVSGDCRAGTTKRVAFAIGDGALAVTCVHDYLGTYR